MERIAEPELMNAAEQVEAYAFADFEQPHAQFIELLLQHTPTAASPAHGYALDLGCGPGDITRRFAKAIPGFYIDAVDGATNMIAMAQRLNREAGLDQRISLYTAMIDSMALPRKDYDFIFSNSLLHHLHDPATLWTAVNVRSRSGTHLFVMDLLRPHSQDEARELVDCYADGEPDILRQDFFHSLCAAYTVEEVSKQLQQHGLDWCSVEQISDRHLIIHGTRT